MEDKARKFEEKVLKGLNGCMASFLPNIRYGVGVSGGADSVSLLTALSRLFPKENILAVTVNHNIRPSFQTEGDALFVEDYCRKIGVKCFRVDLGRGEVERVKKERGGGTEEAARFLRYRVFEDAAANFSLDYFCLAHNKNDQEETLLMRFFSGSRNLSGIPKKRGIFVRPLLDLSRKEIEEYLSFLKLEFRTDSTNCDNSIYRNKIRNVIIPFLDTHLPVWKNSALSLSKRSSLDEDFIKSCADEALSKIDWKEDSEGLSFNAAAFSSLPSALQERILYRSLDRVLEGSPSSLRIPYTFIERLQRNLQILPKIKDVWTENSCGAEVVCLGERILLRKVQKVATESGFFAIIREEGLLHAGNWTVKSKLSGANMHLELEHDFVQSESAVFAVDIEGLEFPFAFRSRQAGDSIKTARGGLKSLSAVLDDWKCGLFRPEIPVIQDLKSPLQPLVCILGAPLGFNNWIVQKEER